MKEITKEQMRLARNAYYREWRKNNKERVSEANARYWAKKAAEYAANEEKKQNEKDG